MMVQIYLDFDVYHWLVITYNNAIMDAVCCNFTCWGVLWWHHPTWAEFLRHDFKDHLISYEILKCKQLTATASSLKSINIKYCILSSGWNKITVDMKPISYEVSYHTVDSMFAFMFHFTFSWTVLNTIAKMANIFFFHFFFLPNPCHR